MPPSVFDPLAAVVVHSQLPVNPLTFQQLEGEAALLVHSCRRQATRQEWRRFNQHGRLLAFVRHSPLLTYSITATALDPTGENLGNYHPGRCLSDRSLAFLNGGRSPFQFETETEGVIPGKFILKDPTQEPGAGDATEVSFTIEHAFVDLDAPAYPGGSIATPSEPDLFVTLDAQPAVSLTADALNAILTAVFHGTDAFGTDPLTLTLYSGDPEGSGTAVSDPLTLTEWTAADEPDTPSCTRLRNHAVIEFLVASEADRAVTHLRWARSGITIASIALSAPVVIPGYYGLRIPVHALALQLTWPQAGAMATSRTEHPAHFALRYLFGSEPLNLSISELYLTGFASDPHTSDAPVGDGALTLSRTSAGWTVSGVAASSAPVTGTAAAPSGGWTIPWVVAGIDGVQTWWIVHQFSHPLTIPAGGTVSIPDAALSVSIS